MEDSHLLYAIKYIEEMATVRPVKMALEGRRYYAKVLKESIDVAGPVAIHALYPALVDEAMKRGFDHVPWFERKQRDSAEPQPTPQEE